MGSFKGSYIFYVKNSVFSSQAFCSKIGLLMLSTSTYQRYLKNLVYQCTYDFWLKDQAATINSMLVRSFKFEVVYINTCPYDRKIKMQLVKELGVLGTADLIHRVGVLDTVTTSFRLNQDYFLTLNEHLSILLR